MTCAARHTYKTVGYACFQRYTSARASFSQEINGQTSPPTGQKSVAMRGEGRVQSSPERCPAGHELVPGRTVVGWSRRDCTSGVRGIAGLPAEPWSRTENAFMHSFRPDRIRTPAMLWP